MAKKKAIKRTVQAPRAPRPSRYDNRAAATEREWAHQNSHVVQSKIRVMQFEHEELDKSIVALSAALANARERRSVVEATLRGLSAVVDRRT